MPYRLIIPCKMPVLNPPWEINLIPGALPINHMSYTEATSGQVLRGEHHPSLSELYQNQ
jgi:hypothetical protein